jgi:hypothetical protein
VNCDLALSLIDDYIEHGLSRRDCLLLEKHFARCSRCAEEWRSRPAFERDVRRALDASVSPLYLSSEATARIVQAASESLNRANWTQRTFLTFRLLGGAVAAVLVLVGFLSLARDLPVASGLRPVALLPASKLILSSAGFDTLLPSEQPAPRLTATSRVSLPAASLLFEPWQLRPQEPFTMTVLLQSDLPQPLETVHLDLDITGPTGYYSFGLAVKGPLPAHGVSVFRVTPDLLVEPAQEQYLMAPSDVFRLPGVYTLRLTVSDPVFASP